MANAKQINPKHAKSCDFVFGKKNRHVNLRNNDQLIRKYVTEYQSWALEKQLAKRNANSANNFSK